LPPVSFSGNASARTGQNLRIIQVVCTSEFAGVERSLTYVAPELARRGHEVTVIGGEPEATAAALAETGVRYLPAASVATAVKALGASRRRAPDVVHSHMTAADLAAVATLPVVRAPLISTLHFAQPRGHTRTRQTVYRLLPWCFSEQIAISEFVSATCGTRAVVVPNGVPDPASPPTDRERVVLVAQRLESEKRTEVALEAWARSSLKQSGWKMEIAGRGAELPRLRDLAERLGIAATIEFVGFDVDVVERMARSSILLATAPGEPFGLSVVEAMAARLPVIAARGGAHEEILRAFPDQLFAPGDAQACAAALEALAGDPVALEDASARGRRLYETRYTIEHHVDRLLDVYARVVA